MKLAELTTKVSKGRIVNVLLCFYAANILRKTKLQSLKVSVALRVKKSKESTKE